MHNKMYYIKCIIKINVLSNFPCNRWREPTRNTVAEWYIPYKSFRLRNSLPQLLAAWKVLISENDSLITTPILLEGFFFVLGAAPTSRMMGVVIGASLSDLITLQKISEKAISFQ